MLYIFAIVNLLLVDVDLFFWRCRLFIVGFGSWFRPWIAWYWFVICRTWNLVSFLNHLLDIFCSCVKRWIWSSKCTLVFHLVFWCLRYVLLITYGKSFWKLVKYLKLLMVPGTIITILIMVEISTGTFETYLMCPSFKHAVSFIWMWRLR